MQAFSGIGDELAGALIRYGYDTPDAVRNAPRDDLLSIPGIAERFLEQLDT